MTNCSLFLPVLIGACALMGAGTLYFFHTLRNTRAVYDEYADHAPSQEELTNYRKWLENEANTTPTTQEATKEFSGFTISKPPPENDKEYL